MERQQVFQKDFFDQRPAEVGWSDLLVKTGFKYLLKPREKKNWQVIKSLGMKKGDRVLDVGCGTGYFLARIEKVLQIDGVGIDFSSESIKKAKRWQKEGLEYLVAEAERLPFEDVSFDYVVCFDVLEHIEKQEKVLKEMARVLKKKGKILIYTINKRQRGTWNWFLEKVGIPTDELVAHDKKLFVFSDDLEKKLEKLGIKKERLIYYDCFFSLFLNEVMTLVEKGLRKLGLERIRFISKPLLFFFTFVSQALGSIVDFLDWPWKKLGLSNGFYFIGSGKNAHTRIFKHKIPACR